jgi:antitoxin FitA
MAFIQGYNIYAGNLRGRLRGRFGCCPPHHAQYDYLPQRRDLLRPAGTYSAQNDYYTEGGAAEPTAWDGPAAASLGLAGAVDRTQLEALLNGELPNGVVLKRGQEVSAFDEVRTWCELVISLLSSFRVEGKHVPDLLVRGVDEAIVKALKERAGAHGRSAEAEHREILAEALARPRRRSLAELLASIPDVGTDADFERTVSEGRAPRVFD